MFSDTLKLFCSEESKGGAASLRSRRCVKRNAVFDAGFKGFSLYCLYQKGNLIRVKTSFDTYLIRIQTRTPLSRYLRVPDRGGLVTGVDRTEFHVLKILWA